MRLPNKLVKMGSIVIAALLSLCVLCSCGNTAGKDSNSSEKVYNGRFVTTSNEATDVNVITDTKTGVQYLVINHGYASSVTVLLDSDGKPLLEVAK